ncbi:hypothetical protein [Brevifollis gellanilyticus]|uniref:Uncharacterized protein n=1 Tax=Brevifollis gellanilyticus TaxID=748831 RepID=A0A512M240_9BACT|nr:hypothetical protein [Brevifollis gellanilyticus]GEP40795.1 hypothetical protein BGE01nite_00860 [Brevifollis gellanilyticus]
MNDNSENEIIWTGDLNDDCTARWAGLMLRAEWMDGPHWWWAVSDMATGEQIISSNNDPQECTSGTSARERAEKAAREWYPRMTNWKPAVPELQHSSPPFLTHGLPTELTRVMAGYGFRPVADLSGIPDAVLLLKRQTWNTNRAIVVVCPGSPPTSLHDYMRQLRSSVAFRCRFLPVLWGIGIQVVLISPGLAQRGIDPSQHVARFDNQWAIVQSIFLVDPDAGTHQEARSWGQYVTGKFQDAISKILFLRHAKALFIQAVRATAHLPSMLRERAADVTGLEMHSFDASYLEFLDTQILLSPRGPEWTALLRARRAALQPFCDISLLRGRVHIGDTDFTVQIHPQTKAVVHWEQHDNAA